MRLDGDRSACGKYNTADHWWGMIIDIDKCIGCGNCVRACSQENGVPKGYFRTWVERYEVEEGEQPHVDSPNGAMDGFPLPHTARIKSFFVPKLCNHCADSPCVQVCPVGATFVSPDGVVLVDRSYCLGCRYCVQACPYGCRYLHPEKNTVDKCTLCYHRITKGLTTACCENLPHRRAPVGGFQEPQRPGARISAQQQGGSSEAVHGDTRQGLLQGPGRRGEVGAE